MPTSLQGLNLVYPPPPPSDNTDTLTPPPGFPDLSAQLDLWTNLSFASDEPFATKDRKEPEFLAGIDHKYHAAGDVRDLSENNPLAASDMPVKTTIDTTLLPNPNHDQTSFDFGTFLAGFGIDPFLVPPQSSQPQRSPPATPSTTSNSSQSHIPANPSAGLDLDPQPPSKRTRTRKGSSASQGPAVAPSALQQRAFGNDLQTLSEFSEDHDPLTTPLTVAEDKRRRNTAASARFRAKKKEREQALEKRSKELETKVTELERECEGLRRENGWLKGLVVGVTGGNPSNVPPIPGESGGSGNSNEINKGKRKRDE